MTPFEPTVELRQERAVVLLHGEPLDTHGERRRCSVDGCTTLLSRYNPNRVCNSHGGWSCGSGRHSRHQQRQGRSGGE